MRASGTALVLVQPADTVAVVVQRALATMVRHVSLLVPADNTSLQERRNMQQLREQLAQAQVELVIISSDERVLNAARSSGIEAIAIEGTSVAGQLLPQAGQGRPAAPQQASADAEEAELLAMLDRMESRTSTGPRHAARSDDPALLDDLDAMLDSQTSSPDSAGRETVPMPAPVRPSRSARPAPAPARPPDTRIDDRVPGRRSPGRTAAQRPGRARPAAASALPDDSQLYDEQDAEFQPRARQSSAPSLTGLIIGLVLVVALLAAAFWALNSRVSVTIYPPEARVREILIEDEVIPVDRVARTDIAAVQAAPVSSDVVYTVSGLVENQTVSPAGRARGVVTVINTVASALPLPEGTEFVGRNAQGAEVRFTVDGSLTIPASTTTASLSGSSTVYGQVDVSVTARSPGAASNIGENTISQIFIPGQQLIDCGTSNFICRNGPIQGGSDEPQWIVTQTDVERILGQALTGLYNNALQQLREQTDGEIDQTTIVPGPEALGRPESYEPLIVEPAIGQPADPTSRAFQVTVRARFTALAMPRGKLMREQLRQVVTAHYAQRAVPLCTTTETATPKIDRWDWDGVSLKITGVMVCVPSTAMPPETRLQVREALRGKSRAAAEASLRELQTQGLIGEYRLPEQVQQLPPLDVLLDVQFADTPPVAAP